MANVGVKGTNALGMSLLCRSVKIGVDARKL